MTQKMRQEQILHILEKKKYVTVQYLVEALAYSSATINRDLNTMQTLGLVKRSYGGVELHSHAGLPPLLQRQTYMRKEKRRIAHEAAQLIGNGETVALDGSTTVQYMIPFLAEKKDLTVITNSLRLAIELGETDAEVICLGGRIAERPHVLAGDLAVEFAMRFHPDKYFFSVGGVTEAGEICGVMLLNRVMIENSREAYFLTDRTKLLPYVTNVLCDFSVLTGVISDFSFPEETVARYPNVKFFPVQDL